MVLILFFGCVRSIVAIQSVLTGVPVLRGALTLENYVLRLRGDAACTTHAVHDEPCPHQGTRTCFLSGDNHVPGTVVERTIQFAISMFIFQSYELV